MNYIQDILNALDPKQVNCIEGALLAAALLELHGKPPLLMDLRANDYDYDHVVAPFQYRGFWGALSKTNYAVLRYREPVYKNIRELAMSYFHEYFLDDGTKTLRSYSMPFNLAKHLGKEWIASEKKIWQVSRLLDRSPHIAILNRSMIAGLHKADAVEIKAGKLKA